MNLSSVERIKEFSEVSEEKYYPSNRTNSRGKHMDGESVEPLESGLRVSVSGDDDDDDDVHDVQWPSIGEVSFVDLCAKYDSSDKLVLRNVSFTVPAGAKVGIVGRTVCIVHYNIVFIFHC
jgi:ABC-type multidrug transport system fused ATPase/permease subunit